MGALLGGYAGKVLRIDLSARRWFAEDLRADWAKAFLGGRGLAARYYWEEMAAPVEPLGPENKLFFFTGPFTGTAIPGAAKTGCVTRSPETGLYCCTNASDGFGRRLKTAGYDGLIIEGNSSAPVFLRITGGGVEFLDASGLWGATTAEVRARLGDERGVISVGPAAERGVVFSCIQSGTRSFGRGGAGAVMAAKMLKAVVADGQGDIPVAEPAALRELLPELRAKVREKNRELSEFGRASLTDVINGFGCYPTRNFRWGTFDLVEGITATEMRRRYFRRRSTCQGCPIGCAQLCEVPAGPLGGRLVDPEYETIWAFGAQCGNGDFGTILAANLLADDYGVDTISAGHLVGFAMEAFEKGVISPADTGGLELQFGSSASLLGLLEMICRVESAGKVLAGGFRRLAQAWPQAKDYMMHVKWLPFPAYEPRGFYGMALAYATSSRGACHNVGGWTIRAELQTGQHDRFAVEGKGALVKGLQDVRAVVDSVGICTAARSPLGFGDNPEPSVLKLVTGVAPPEPLLAVGERIYTLERMILVREGVSRADDRLPARITGEVLPDGDAAGRKFTADMHEKLLDDYYRERGWDSDGRPTRESLRRLGLDALAAPGKGGQAGD